jgi:hypothetical protein
MSDQEIRNHLVDMVTGVGAHVGFDKVVADFPVEMRGVVPDSATHSAWKLLEHLRIAQWDILEFSRDASHVSPDFPSGYWPESALPPREAAWDMSIKSFKADGQDMAALIANPATDLFEKIPHGTGQTVFKEAYVVAKHNSYHLGELVMLRRVLGIWN